MIVNDVEAIFSLLLVLKRVNTLICLLVESFQVVLVEPELDDLEQKHDGPLHRFVSHLSDHLVESPVLVEVVAGQVDSSIFLSRLVNTLLEDDFA